MTHHAVHLVVGGGVAAAGARAGLLGGLRGLVRVGLGRRIGLARLARRLRRGHRRHGGGRRLVRQRARHAAHGGGALRARLAGLLAADDRLGRVLVRLVAFVGVLDGREVHVGGDLGVDVVLAEDRREDGFHALHVVLFHLLHELELAGVQRAVIGAGEQVAVLVDDGDRLRREFGHAGRDQVADGGDLAFIDGAARVELQHDRRGGLLALAHEQGGLGDGQVHAGRLHGADRLDRAGEFAFQAALVVDLLGKLADAELLVIHQLHAGVAVLRQALAGELEAHFVHLVRRHHQRAAAFGELVRHVHLLEGGHHGAAVALGQVAVQHLVVRRA
ncbi:hypothetical protein D3C86_1290630 [compost metagenome]